MKWRTAVSVCAAGFLVACQNNPPSSTPVTVGTVPIDSVATTLLPDVVISFVPDDTLPPGTLFAGQLCNALTADDFDGVGIAGVGSGRLTATQELADDLCGYVVRASGDDYTVLVRARTAIDLEQPAPSGEEIEPLSGIGLAAVGVIRSDDTYEVIVQVESGYFSVASPDRSSARALARAAAERSADF
ncbi:MAG: hypothetical protein Q8M22_01595 [Actinomycetota bacterium]|nr:hypothetical protein [Actinomycetota bacterium]